MTTCRKCRKRKATVALINRHTNKDVPLCDTCQTKVAAEER